MHFMFKTFVHLLFELLHIFDVSFSINVSNFGLFESAFVFCSISSNQYFKHLYVECFFFSSIFVRYQMQH